MTSLSVRRVLTTGLRADGTTLFVLPALYSLFGPRAPGSAFDPTTAERLLVVVDFSQG